MQNTICHNVGNTTQIVCTIKLRRRLATLFNVARDSKNVSNTWSHTLHEAVQTYGVEMTFQCSICFVSVTNNHARPIGQALHTTIRL